MKDSLKARLGTPTKLIDVQRPPRPRHPQCNMGPKPGPKEKEKDKDTH